MKYSSKPNILNNYKNNLKQLFILNFQNVNRKLIFLET
jgi:hypothetical protein